MTNEAFEQGLKLKNRIREVDDIIGDLTPYLNNNVDITINMQARSLHYRLKYNDPLWLAIGSALKDMRNELQLQFDELNYNSHDTLRDPIQKTKAWFKVWEKK